MKEIDLARKSCLEQLKIEKEQKRHFYVFYVPTGEIIYEGFETFIEAKKTAITYGLNYAVSNSTY
jgi:hypothetical protein